MLKQILLFCFFVSIVSSCKCNKGTETTTSTDSSSTVSTDGTAMKTDTNADSIAAANAKNNSAATNGSTQNTTKSLFKKGHASASSGSKGYFPEGSDRLLQRKDVEFLTEWGLGIMKNEIYARHGMIFDQGMLKDHFEQQPWYHASSTNVNGKLSSIEKSNLNFIENYKYVPDAKDYNANGTADHGTAENK